MPEDAAAIDSSAAQGLDVVEADMFYLTPLAEKPFLYVYPVPDDVKQTNAEFEARRVPIHDARPIASGLSLDREGFALVHSPTAVTDFRDEAQLSGLCADEAAKIVARATGASRVKVFDHTLRIRTDDPKNPGAPGARTAVFRVHNDYTEGSAPQRVRDLMGDEAEDLLSRRFAFVNVWRPIKGPVIDSPLAVCDCRTIAPGDILTEDLIYPDRRGEVQVVTYNPAHRWSYFPRMEVDEVMLIKCFDSRRDVARFAAHSAFIDPNTPPDAEPRESIEIRTVAFFD